MGRYGEMWGGVRLVQGEGLTQLAEVAKSVAQMAELDSLPPPVAAL